MTLGIPVVHNRQKGTFENELDYLFNGRPEEYISVIENAKYVVTNSFHTTVFSLIYEKDFITIPHATRPGRMKELLDMVGLSNHLVEDVRIMPKLDTLKINLTAMVANCVRIYALYKQLKWLKMKKALNILE